MREGLGGNLVCGFHQDKGFYLTLINRNTKNFFILKLFLLAQLFQLHYSRFDVIPLFCP